MGPCSIPMMIPWWAALAGSKSSRSSVQSRWRQGSPRPGRQRSGEFPWRLCRQGLAQTQGAATYSHTVAAWKFSICWANALHSHSGQQWQQGRLMSAPDEHA